MSTTYPLTDELDVTEQSSRFSFSVRLPLKENDLDHDYAHTQDIDGAKLLLVAAELIKVASYSMGQPGRKEGMKAIQDAFTYLKPDELEECIACTFSGVDEERYRAHGCPGCTCGRY